MKKLFIFLLFVPLYSVGQNFSIYELANLVHIKDAEFLMYKKGSRSIEANKYYSYEPISRSESCESDPYNKQCDWKCITGHGYNYVSDGKGGKKLNMITSKSPKSDIEYEYYQKKLTQTSKFASDYNSLNKTAKTFIDIKYVEKTDNGNCNKIFSKPSYRLIIDIQFNYKSEFEYLKNSIVDNAEYDETKIIRNPLNNSPLGSPVASFHFFNKKNNRKMIFKVEETDNYARIRIFT